MIEGSKNAVNWDVPSLSAYVKKNYAKDEEALTNAAAQWLDVSTRNGLNYEIRWMGVPVIQTPEDLVLMQELIFECKPDFVIETGIAHGGSLIYYASLFEILGKGEVIGIDIDIREHNREVIEKHPLYHRIHMIEGDSISGAVIEKVRKRVHSNADCIACLDSNHKRNHVLEELRLYKEFVSIGSYMVVFDTIASSLAEAGACEDNYVGNGPAEAVNEFLMENREFVIDPYFNRLFISTSPNGYLKRIG